MRWVNCRWPVMVGALAALLPVVLAGCAAAKSGPDLAKSQVLRVGLAGGLDADTLDPDVTYPADATSVPMMSLLYDPLVTLDAQMRVENWGAARVEVSADGLTYTFHLRAGQRFADGTPVTAADYAYSLDRTLNPCVASPVSYYLFAIKDALTFSNELCQHGVLSTTPYPPQQGPLLTTLIGDSIVVSDPATLAVTITQPAAAFLVALTFPGDAALDPAVVGPNIANEGWTESLTTGRGTSGMFAVSSWDHTAGKLVLKPNPHWWGLRAGKKPYLSEIDFSFYLPFQDTSQVPDAFGRGQLDIGEPAPGDLPQAQTRRDIHRVPIFTTASFIMQWHTPPYDNQDARQALCLAVNRDALNQQLYGGQRIPTWHIVPQGMPGYNAALTGPDGLTSTRGDPTAARAHWQAYLQSLHGAKPPALAFYYVEYDDSTENPEEQLGQALAQQWQAVLGVSVTVKGFPSGLDLGPGNHFPLTGFGWTADYPDPQDFLSLLLSASSQYNPGGVSVPAADNLTAQADVLSDPPQRYALYKAAEQLYVNAVALCPLFQGTTDYLARPQVHGWQMDGRGLTPDDAWLATYIART